MQNSLFYSWPPVRGLQRDINSLLQSFYGPEGASFVKEQGGVARFPSVNAWESSEQFTLEAELPGVSSSDVELVVVGNEVTIKGERKVTAPPNGAAHRREIPTGKFNRVLQFPCKIEPDQVNAELKNGVLTVRLPKSVEARPKRIAIHTQ